MRVNEASKGDMHVTSQDQAFANMSFLGKGVWVDQLYGNKLAMNMASANLLEIETGAFWADGRYVQVELPTSVEVANGQTGLVRHDLLCLKNKIVNGHDNFSFVVLQGTPAASNPSDPTPQNDHISDEYGESYAPIARIVLNGLVPTVEMLCSFLPVWSADIDGSRLAKKSVPGDRLKDGTIGQDKLDQATRDFLSQTARIQGESWTQNIVVTVRRNRPYLAYLNGYVYCFAVIGNPEALNIYRLDGTRIASVAKGAKSEGNIINNVSVSFTFTENGNIVTIWTSTNATSFVFGL